MTIAPILPPRVGSGKVTDSQVAFMVECYLRDSHFPRTLKEFRLEAARLLHPLRSVPKGARSLSAVLNDYVVLKEDQISATTEKARVEELFHGLQEILAVYLAGAPKNNGSNTDLGNGKLANASPSPCVTPVTTMQQPQLHGSAVSEVGNALGVADHHSKEKFSSSKRKSLETDNHSCLQQLESSLDPSKKSRRTQTKQSLIDPSLTGHSIKVDSPTGSNSSTVSKSAQPATPPMNNITSSKVHQQQALPSHVLSGSPQSFSLPTANRSNLIPHIQASCTQINPGGSRDLDTQGHQDPQTPPPSALKSSFADSCTSAVTTSNEECRTDAAFVQGKPIDQQSRKVPLPHVSSSSCPYTLRAHKKSALNAANAVISDGKLNASQKGTRKKAYNSKCRLLDFSSAAVEESKQLSPLNQHNKERHEDIAISHQEPILSSDCGQSVADPHLESAHSSQNLNISCAELGSDLSASTQSSFDPQTSEFILACDTFSFDELFDLELDTNLISELEELSELGAIDPISLSCVKSSDTDISPLAPESKRVLVDVSNMYHSDEPAFLVQSNNSPSKGRKLGNIPDKENMLSTEVVGVSQI